MPNRLVGLGLTKRCKGGGVGGWVWLFILLGAKRLVAVLIPNPAQVGLEFDEQRRMAVEREVDGGDGLPESLKFGGVSGVVGRRSGKGS